MSFVVLYDANVLYPSTLRDLLIRVAQAGLVQAKWSDQILDEVFRNLTANRPDLDRDLFDFFRDLLLLRVRGETETELVMRFQQLTGPAMAKGVEDTAFYCFNRLVSLNEVGGNPGQFGLPVDAPVVLGVSRLVPRKGFDVLLDAVAGLDGVHVAIAGAGRDAARLERRARGLGERAHQLARPLVLVHHDTAPGQRARGETDTLGRLRRSRRRGRPPGAPPPAPAAAGPRTVPRACGTPARRVTR